MRIRTIVTACLVSSLLWSSSAIAAPQHVVAPAAMQQALADQALTDQQNRDAVLSVLRTSQVRELADRLGLSVTSAEGAVSSLSSAELAPLAEQARTADAQLAGGANTVVISTTTLLLVIIIIILLAN